MKKAEPTNQVFQLKLSVRDIDPPIWRRLLVRSDITLSRLHLIIQSLMDWQNYHLYQFHIADQTHGPPTDDDDLYGKRKSVRLRLSSVFKVGLDTMIYEYDFGDGWEIDIKLEDAFQDTQKENAICIDGARHGPIEDSGGPLGYQEKLGILKDRSHPEYKAIHRWIGPRYKPEECDLEEANRYLAAL
jgi:hypothetical protein